jgi:hypothetical protein
VGTCVAAELASVGASAGSEYSRSITAMPPRSTKSRAVSWCASMVSTRRDTLLMHSGSSAAAAFSFASFASGSSASVSIGVAPPPAPLLAAAASTGLPPMAHSACSVARAIVMPVGRSAGTWPRGERGVSAGR